MYSKVCNLDLQCNMRTPVDCPSALFNFINVVLKSLKLFVCLFVS